MKSTKLDIINRKGYSLRAHLELPATEKANHYAIFAHCFTCNSTFIAVRDITRILTNYGFGVVRFDFTGLGRSEGEFAESHFSANINDLLDVHQYMKENYSAPGLMIGHSLGGAAVIAASSLIDDVKAIATIASPSTSHHVKHHFADKIDEAREKGEAEVNIAGRPFKINKEFVEDFDKINLTEVIKNLGKPILILHSPGDKIVPIENASDIYHNAKHPKSFVSLDGADHFLSDVKDSTYAGNVIGVWVQRYFEKKQNQMLDTEGEQLVAHLNLNEHEFTTHMQTRNHNLIADEPASVGGDDFGPSPYELLSASLAACKVMTLKLYAVRKKWDLQEVYAYVTHSRIHSNDMDIDGNEPQSLDHLAVKLKFVGDLSQEQRDKLKAIASRCPVHRTLKNEVVIETTELKE